MDEKLAILICQTWAVRRVPIEGSEVRRCIECRAPVWLSTSTRVEVFDVHLPIILCPDCASEVLTDPEILIEAPTPGQIAEFNEHQRRLRRRS